MTRESAQQVAHGHAEEGQAQCDEHTALSFIDSFLLSRVAALLPQHRYKSLPQKSQHGGVALFLRQQIFHIPENPDQLPPVAQLL